MPMQARFTRLLGGAAGVAALAAACMMRGVRTVAAPAASMPCIKCRRFMEGDFFPRRFDFMMVSKIMDRLALQEQRFTRHHLALFVKALPMSPVSVDRNWRI